MIQEEAAAGFKVAAADGKIFSVLRTEVEELKNSGRSLMPEGFEKDLSPAALADLQARDHLELVGSAEVANSFARLLDEPPSADRILVTLHGPAS